MQRAALISCFVGIVGVGCKKTDPAPAQPPVVASGSGVAIVVDAAPPGSGTGSGSGSGSAPVEDDSWSPKVAKQQTIDKPFLWEVAKDGKQAYLLGTIHVGVDAEQQLPKVVFDKLDAATTFSMETDTTDPTLANMGTRTNGGTLHAELGPVYWKKLEDVIGANVADAIDKKKPMIAAMIVSLKGLPQTPPMDGILHARATRLKKRIVFLESAASQAAVLEKHMTVKVLKMMLDDPQKGIDSTKALLATYLAGDEPKFLANNAQQREDAIAGGYTAAEYDEFIEDLAYKRNAAWIPKIEQLVAEGPSFIAVGALHLVGPRSVIDLLAKKGYKITRIGP